MPVHPGLLPHLNTWPGCMETADFSNVTEVPGARASREQAAMLYTRYAFAAGLCRDKEILEVACGSGMGLGFLARTAKRVVGGDCTQGLLQQARMHYGARIPLVRLDAHKLPFRDRSFDAIILFEAIYYLADPSHFLQECRRVLREGGGVIVCSANKEWDGFNRSPFSHMYYSSGEIAELLGPHGFTVDLFGGFPTEPKSALGRVIMTIRKLAVAWNLIPRTMKGKELLKRVFYGKMIVLPGEIPEGMAREYALDSIPAEALDSSHKVLYAVGRLVR